MNAVMSADARSWHLQNVECPLCASSSAKFVLQKRGRYIVHEFSIVQCSKCGFVYVNPRVSDDEIPLLYDDAYFRGEGFDGTVNYADVPESFAFYDLTADSLEIALGTFRSKKVLDFGCGSGGLLAELLRRSVDAVGVDTAADALKIAVARGLPAYQVSDELMHSFAGRFDAVVLMEVIEHTPDPIALLRVIYGLLRPGGIVLITTGNWNLVRWQPKTPYVMPEGHIGYFDPQTLAFALSRAGFTTRSFPENRSWIGSRALLRGGRALASYCDPIARSVIRFAPKFGPFPLGVKGR